MNGLKIILGVWFLNRGYYKNYKVTLNPLFLDSYKEVRRQIRPSLETTLFGWDL